MSQCIHSAEMTVNHPHPQTRVRVGTTAAGQQTVQTRTCPQHPLLSSSQMQGALPFAHRSLQPPPCSLCTVFSPGAGAAESSLSPQTGKRGQHQGAPSPSSLGWAR